MWPSNAVGACVLYSKRILDLGMPVKYNNMRVFLTLSLGLWVTGDVYSIIIRVSQSPFRKSAGRKLSTIYASSSCRPYVTMVRS